MVFISTSTLYFRYLIGCLYPRYNIRREYNTARCFCQILDLSTGCFCTYSSFIQSVLWLQPQQSKFLSGNNVYNPRGSKYCEAILAKIWTVNTGNEVKMAKLKTWTRSVFYDGSLLSFTDKLSSLVTEYTCITNHILRHKTLNYNNESQRKTPLWIILM